jgi:hypothetical protein
MEPSRAKGLAAGAEALSALWIGIIALEDSHSQRHRADIHQVFLLLAWLLICWEGR